MTETDNPYDRIWQETPEDKALGRTFTWPMLPIAFLHLLAIGSLTRFLAIVAVGAIALAWFIIWRRRHRRRQ